MEWREGVSLIVVTVSEGYPGTYTKGQLITGLKEAEASPGVKVSAKILEKMLLIALTELFKKNLLMLSSYNY